MISRLTSISRKELYSGSMVIFIALFYLLLIGSNLAHVSIRRIDWPLVKMLLLALFYLVAGILFFSRKTAGWMMSSGILLHFVLTMCVLIFTLAGSGIFDKSAGMAFILFFLLLLALIFLFSRKTRKKYSVNNKSYLVTIAIYLLLLAVNYVL